MSGIQVKVTKDSSDGITVLDHNEDHGKTMSV
jgi:hypothetical protein